MIGEDRFLMLETGQRVEQGLGQVEMKVSEFKVYGTRTDEDSETIALPSTRAIPTVVLLQNPTPSNMGEFSWRVGLIASTFNLMVIALAITSANPRVGRGGNLALAMLMFLTYTNFINLGQALVNDGKIQWLVFLFTLHGGTLLLSLAWLTVRANNWSWRQLLPRNTKLQPR
jgi:lipopolysaccharide export system permease protein